MTENMNTWLQFLTGQGANFDEDTSLVTGFSGGPAQTGLPRGFVAPLTDLGVISATGDDAAHFLHSQLTNDVEHLGQQEVRLAGYCSPKGRLLATMRIWTTADAIMLQLPRAIQPALQKRLQMFILRAKAKLADTTDNIAILGLGGQPAAEALHKWFAELPVATFGKMDNAYGTLVRDADAFGEPRYQWIAPTEVAQQAWPELIRTLTPVSTSVWRLADIHAGMPQVTPPTQEQFVPQMINFELIGGVNFKKGCYPGQEIVARSQYLGKLKRRMLLATIDTSAASAGMEIFSSSDPEQPCGMIVNAERNLQDGIDCLVEIKIAATEEGVIHLGSAQGPVLKFGTLPYALPG